LGVGDDDLSVSGASSIAVSASSIVSLAGVVASYNQFSGRNGR